MDTTATTELVGHVELWVPAMSSAMDGAERHGTIPLDSIRARNLRGGGFGEGQSVGPESI